jgi:hypothetical protein
MKKNSLKAGLAKHLVIACIAVSNLAYGDDDPAIGRSLATTCAGDNCGALMTGDYAGKGVGVWHYKNDRDTEIFLPVSIRGVAGSSFVSLVYTNEDADDQQLSMGSRPLEAGIHDAVKLPVEGAREVSQCQDGESTWYFAGRFKENNIPNPVRIAYPHCTILVQTVQAHDGRPIHFWVERSEFGDTKISKKLIAAIANRFAQAIPNVYDIVTDISGGLWGPHEKPRYIKGDSPRELQPLNIVFVNSKPDGAGTSGFAGLFMSMNALNEVRIDGQQISARKLSVFINTENILAKKNNWRDNDPTNLNVTKITEFVKSVLAHEITHLANFYHHDVLSGPESKFKSWLEEMSAMMVQHIADNSIAPGFDEETGKSYSYDEVGKLRVRGWLNSRGNCSLVVYRANPACNSYAIGGSFAAYLVHQYGPAIYRNLRKAAGSSHDSLTLLDNAIKASGGRGVTDSLWRHGVALVLLPGAEVPQDFGFPARTDGHYRLSPIDGASLYRIPTAITPLDRIPDTILPYGFVSIVRPTNGEIYQEVIPVPPHTSVTVLVQQK